MIDINLLPVFVLSGFLGSGKTTLLNAVLKGGEFANTAVIVNEFGEIGLDHLLLAPGSDNVVLLESGCLCCTIADSLHETLADLNHRKTRGQIPQFDRVIIETSGLADPAPILNTLLGNRLVTDHYRLAAVIVAVDAQHTLPGFATHPEVIKQIAVADRLIITKLDLVDLPAGLLARLAQINPGAAIYCSTDQQCVPQLFSCAEAHLLRTDLYPENGHPDQAGVVRHDQQIRAHCFVIPDVASWAGIAAWWRLVNDRFGDRLLRCKGLLRIVETDEIIFLQCVQKVFHRPERLPDWPDADRRSRLVCITRDVDEAQLRATLDAFSLERGLDPHLSLAQLNQERHLQ